MVSTPNRSVTQRPHRRNPPWLPSGSVFWTIPHEALIDQNQASTPIALKPASATAGKVWLSRQSLRRRQSSLILASTVGETFDQGAGRVDSAPGRSLSFALCHETAALVFTVGRVVSTPYRRVGSQLLQSETTLQPSGGYLHWRQLHAQSYGGTYIWISLQYAAHFQVPHTTKRHRRTDKQSRCLNGSCSAVAGYVETSKFSRWLKMP